MNKKNLNLFFKTMFDRQKIWENRFINKIANKDEWTNDELFKKYKFTNVYRELDRSSQFLINNIIISNDNLQNILFKILIYKFFNRPEPFKEISLPSIENYKTYSKDFFKQLENYKGSIFHSAYSFYRNAKNEGYKNNMDAFQRTVFPYILDNIEILESYVKNADIQNLMKFLTSIYTVGPFLAHEFFQDITYIPKYNENFKDLTINGLMFTNLGPGSEIGLKSIFEDKSEYENDFKNGYDILLKKAEKELAKHGDFFYIKWNKDHYENNKTCNFTYSQIEHWLCEFYKYKKYLETPNIKHKEFKQHTFVN